MNDDQVGLHFQLIYRQIAPLQREAAENWEEVDAALEDLHVIYEQMQASLEAAEDANKDLLQQNQHLAERYHHYYDLFQSLPIAYLITDTDGVIVEANSAIAQLLNVPQRYLSGKPLVVYIAEGERLDFQLKLNQLSQSSDIQVWQTNFCPREGKPLAVELHIDTVRSGSGLIEQLRIAVYNISRSQETLTQLTQRLNPEEIQVEETMAMPRLPQSLDGLRVLVVDDEADAREFITVVLEAYGIRVRAVASAAAALEELEQFHPDVLVSDIRMPNGDGYSLIQQIRTLEAEHLRHIPAAAITAYLDEDRAKALSAGFEAHLHKLAQPSDLVEMVAQLVGLNLSSTWTR